MDDFDRSILALVQTDNRLSSEKIGEAVGLSPAAVQKRLKRLRDNGTICADIAVIAPERIGLSMTIIAEVTLERENLAVLDAFKRRMRSSPTVQQCYYTTGSADFILILTVRDIKDYEEFTREYFFGNAEIRKFQTNIVMDTVKAGLTVPIDMERG
ncbi:AsnC family transcriptional regulator [Stappia sp. GBMRC 2046]|uniref:AsnC family transcriptional regulator n=1 Tax=Stappia sediminis TaxID=2692190 RepID=A0A7X3LY21_9HYPH|nr:Lrp/AsnC family transcriptional regulator [Stappia sediminis]MXN67205.1 AsnC family transcriptional regulator [Stappia sediminis]